MAIKKSLVIGEQVPVRVSKAGDTLEFPSSSSTGSSIRIPPGTAPSSPANGDVWALNDGLYVRYNNQTVGPLGAGGGITVPGSADSILYSAGGGTMSADVALRRTGTGISIGGRGILDYDWATGGSPFTVALQSNTLDPGSWFIGNSFYSYDVGRDTAYAAEMKVAYVAPGFPSVSGISKLVAEVSTVGGIVESLSYENSNGIHKVWHEDNDGAGSGLDADLLDGQHGTYYRNVSNMNAGTLAIARGGTGATTVAAARNNLGLGNTSGAVPIANGGTGATTVALARYNLGLGNTSGAVPIASGGTGATSAANARSNLGLGTAATHNVPASGNAASNQVVLGNDSRLHSLPNNADWEVLFNYNGHIFSDTEMTFDGMLFKAPMAQARLAEQILNATTTLSNSTVPNLNRVIKKTTTAALTYTISNTLGANGDTLTIVNGASAGNITLNGTGVTLYRTGSALTSVIIGPRQILTIYRLASNAWIV